MLFSSSFICGVVLLAAPCLAAPADLGLKFNRRDGALPTLTLPYGTWQASHYEPNGDVCSPYSRSCLPLRMNDMLKITKDLYLQEHPLRGSSNRRPEMGQASTSIERDGGARWILRPCLHPGAHQGSSAYRSWRQFANWISLKSISCRHPDTVFQSCLGRYDEFSDAMTFRC